MNEDRQAIWDDYLKDGGLDHKIVRHMFLDYNRYYEADYIRSELIRQGKDISNMSILDYGCGVGDYGIEFLRNHAKHVGFYDFPRATRLVAYRLGREKLKNGEAISADHTPFKKFHSSLGSYDLIIFGEVLEHLHDPLAILKICDFFKVPYLFTSSYPYRSMDPTDAYWNNHDHDDTARLLQPACIKLLEDNYNFTEFGGKLRLWHRK